MSLVDAVVRERRLLVQYVHRAAAITWMRAIALGCVVSVVVCVLVRIGSEMHTHRGRLARGRRAALVIRSGGVS